MKTINIDESFCKSSLTKKHVWFTSVISSSFNIVVDLFCPLQSTSCTALEMPTSAKVLQVILEYIYTDESPTIRGISILLLRADFNYHNGHMYN